MDAREKERETRLRRELAAAKRKESKKGQKANLREKGQVCPNVEEKVPEGERFRDHCYALFPEAEKFTAIPRWLDIGIPYQRSPTAARDYQKTFDTVTSTIETVVKREKGLEETDRAHKLENTLDYIKTPRDSRDSGDSKDARCSGSPCGSRNSGNSEEAGSLGNPSEESCSSALGISDEASDDQLSNSDNYESLQRNLIDSSTFGHEFRISTRMVLIMPQTIIDGSTSAGRPASIWHPPLPEPHAEQAEQTEFSGAEGPAVGRRPPGTPLPCTFTDKELAKTPTRYDTSSYKFLISTIPGSQRVRRLLIDPSPQAHKQTDTILPRGITELVTGCIGDLSTVQQRNEAEKQAKFFRPCENQFYSRWHEQFFNLYLLNLFRQTRSLMPLSTGRLMDQEQRALLSLGPKCAVLRSRIHGYGLFAAADILPGEFIIEYQGVLINTALAELRERSLISQDFDSTYLFTVDRGAAVVDATACGNAARFANHSCDPNATSICIDHRVYLLALRMIPAGEEICYNYRIRREPGKPRMKCHCGAPNCQKYMDL